MAINWTKEKINELSVQEISALQENARIRGNSEITDLCADVLATKKPLRKTRTTSTTKTLEAECSHQLSEFAIQLSNKYDLSAETATKKSEGTKGFRSHKLTSKDGQAKLGGQQRTGKVGIDRYISYRVKNDLVSLGAWLISKDSPEELVWQVLGPKRFFENFKSIKELRPSLFEVDASDEAGGEEFVDFQKASERFEAVISELVQEHVGSHA
jgi:hypothetical protein